MGLKGVTIISAKSFCPSLCLCVCVHIFEAPYLYNGAR